MNKRTIYLIILSNLVTGLIAYFLTSKVPKGSSLEPHEKITSSSISGKRVIVKFGKKSRKLHLFEYDSSRDYINYALDFDSSRRIRYIVYSDQIMQEPVEFSLHFVKAIKGKASDRVEYNLLFNKNGELSIQKEEQYRVYLDSAGRTLDIR